MTEHSQSRPKGWDDGWVKKWEATGYVHSAGDVYALARPVIERINFSKGAHLLDLGCGDGRITRLFLDGEPFSPYELHVKGVDYSDAMVAAAKERGIDAQQMDAAKLTFDNEFDIVFSLSALHWVHDAEDVVAGVARALKPGGQFITEFARNSPPTIRKAIIDVMREEFGHEVEVFDPWRRTTIEEYRSFLEKHGLGGVGLVLRPVDRLQFLPGGMKKWLNTFIRDSFLSPLDTDEEKNRAIGLIVEKLRHTTLYNAGDDKWYADYERMEVGAIRQLQRVVDLDSAVPVVAPKAPGTKTL